jgi:uncharacterized membrane protein YphA (DoxX/SURF4 family)
MDEHRGYLLALARIFLGLLFLETWVENLTKGLYWTNGYADFIRNYADNNVLPLYPDFLDRVVIPNAAFFSKAQMFTELVIIGLFLLVGFLTPVAGVVAGLFALNLLLATRGTGDWWGTYAMLLVLAFLVGLAQAGRTWGIDARFADRNPYPRLPVY